MRRTRDPEQLLSEQLPHVRVTRAEKEEIYRAAEERGLTVTDYLRVLIFRRLPRNKLKKLQLVDTKVLTELMRQGANLRDLYNEYKHTGLFDKVKSAMILDKIHETVKYICEVYKRYLEGMTGGQA